MVVVRRKPHHMGGRAKIPLTTRLNPFGGDLI